VARDEVRVDRQAQHPQAAVEVVLPDRRVPLDELLAAPDVVDEQVEAAVLGLDAAHERLDLRRHEVVDVDGDALATRVGHELGGLLDRLRAVVLRAPLARRAPRAVDRRVGLAERDGRAAAGAAGGARDERDLACQRTRHGDDPTPGGGGPTRR
jgi:hypothetical protein